jgi:Kef-type K+ transport system membrane component KefB
MTRIGDEILAYCMIIGLISGTFSIFIDWLIVLSVVAFVFASITIWYMFGDKFHRWEERRRTKEKYLL